MLQRRKRARLRQSQRESELGSNHKEMEDYKSKRIAARNEMINLQALSSMRGSSSSFTIQFVLSPMVTEQIKGIKNTPAGIGSRICQLLSGGIVGE